MHIRSIEAIASSSTKDMVIADGTIPNMSSITNVNEFLYTNFKKLNEFVHFLVALSNLNYFVLLNTIN